MFNPKLTDSDEKVQQNMKFHCDQCDFQTNNDQTLNNHKNSVHLLMRRFACPYCEYKSYYNNCVKIHLRSQHKGLEDRTVVIGCSDCEGGAKHQICKNGQPSLKIIQRKRKTLEDKTCRICTYETNGQSDQRSQMAHHFKVQHVGCFVFSCEYANMEVIGLIISRITKERNME